MSPYTCPQGHTSEAGDYCDTCGAPIAAAGEGSAGSGGTGAGVVGSGAAVSAAGTGAGAGGAAPSTATPGPGAGVATGAGGSRSCPNCGVANTPEALFCEACGYDFTTGTLPRPPEAAPAPGASALDLGPTPSGEQGAAAPGGQPVAVPDGQTGGETGAAQGEQPPVAPTVPLEWVAEVWVDPDWYAVQESEQTCPSAGPPTVVPLTLQSVLVGRRSASRNIHPQVDCSADTGVSRRQAQLTTDGQRWWVEDLQSSNGTYVGPASGPLPEDPITPGQRHELDQDDRIYIGAWTRLVVRRATPEEQAGPA